MWSYLQGSTHKVSNFLRKKKTGLPCSDPCLWVAHMLITHTWPCGPLTFFSSSGSQYEELSERRSISFAMVQLYRLLDGLDQRHRLKQWHQDGGSRSQEACVVSKQGLACVAHHTFLANCSFRTPCSGVWTVTSTRVLKSPSAHWIIFGLGRDIHKIKILRLQHSPLNQKLRRRDPWQTAQVIVV